MLSNCPQCSHPLRFSEAQRTQIEKAIKKLTTGKSLTIKCPHCQAPIKLGPNTSEQASRGLQPPEPPDLDWLKTGQFEGEEKVEDVPMALVLFKDSPQRDGVVEALKSVGYQVVLANTPSQAMERMRFVSFACVVLHSEFEGKELAKSVFHKYMRKMSMERRRYIFYVIVGPSLDSLYDVQALANSANLVVGEKDLQYFDVILHKSIPSYEELFGPMLEELANYGKR